MGGRTVSDEPGLLFFTPMTPAQAAIPASPGAVDERELYFNRFFLAFGESQTSREETIVDEIARPFVRLWEWVEQVGGFPGQVFFICGIILVVIGGLTWYSNKR